MEAIYDILRKFGIFEFLLIALIYLYHNIAYEDAEYPVRTSGKDASKDLPVFDLDSSSHPQNSAGVLSCQKKIRQETDPIPLVSSPSNHIPSIC